MGDLEWLKGANGGGRSGPPPEEDFELPFEPEQAFPIVWGLIVAALILSHCERGCSKSVRLHQP